MYHHLNSVLKGIDDKAVPFVAVVLFSNAWTMFPLFLKNTKHIQTKKPIYNYRVKITLSNRKKCKGRIPK